MSDVREAILARLLEVVNAPALGISYGQRNDLNLSEQNLPAAIVLDGPEDVDSNALDRRLPNLASMLVHMEPGINIVLQDKVANVGTLLNEVRVKIVNAILSDTALIALTGVGGNRSVGSMRYLGCAPAVAEGRMLQGQMVLRFRISYVFKPSEL